MKKSFTIITFVFILICDAYCQCSDFLFTKTKSNSDFIFERIANIDDYLLESDVSMDSVFETQNGVFDIIFFERYVYGESVLGHYAFFHEAIISKVYEGIITESYFVSYDWKEPPLSNPIQVSHKKLPIKREIKINEFDFKPLNELGINLLEDDCNIIIPDNVDLLLDSER